jgi:hypothetical protein
VAKPDEQPQPEQKQLDPNKPVFFLVPQTLVTDIVKNLGKLPASKVFQTLTQLNQCQPIQPNDAPE